jgi:hypothetical protein
MHNGRVIADRWGVHDSETERAYPCDEFVTAPTAQVWRGVTVEAPADVVWRWVTQVRLAPYSYDWIDNLGRRSPRELVDLPEPKVGDRFTTAAGGLRMGRIVAIEPGRELTARIIGAYMSYVLVPESDDRTRLLLKVVIRTNWLFSVGLSVGDLVMARRQLLNFKHLAERSMH